MKCASKSENWNRHITRSVSWPWRSASNRALARWPVPGDNTCWKCWSTAHGCLLTLQQNKNHKFYYIHYVAKCCDLSVIFKVNKFQYVVENRVDAPKWYCKFSCKRCHNKKAPNFSFMMNIYVALLVHPCTRKFHTRSLKSSQWNEFSARSLCS